MFRLRTSLGATLRVAAVWLFAACDGEESGSESNDETSGGPGCDAETRDDSYAVGLERSGDHVTARFVDAMPAPPDRGDNRWVLDILDRGTLTPLGEFDLEVDPFMPDHMHGTSIACNVTPTDVPGQVSLEPVNLFMPGLWEVRLNFALDEGATDQVVFRFCVDP